MWNRKWKCWPYLYSKSPEYHENWHRSCRQKCGHCSQRKHQGVGHRCKLELQIWKWRLLLIKFLADYLTPGKKSSWGIVIFCNTYQSSIPIYDWFRPKPSKVSLLTSFIHPLTPYKAVCVIFCRSMLPTATAHWLDFTLFPTLHSFFPRLPHVARRCVLLSRRKGGGKGAKQLVCKRRRCKTAAKFVHTFNPWKQQCSLLDKYQRHTNRNEWYWM